MSQALASARKRRAPAPVNPIPVNQSNVQTNTVSSNSGLTLPQVISLVDNRLVKLEIFMNETKNTAINKSISLNNNGQSNELLTNKNNVDELSQDLTNIVSEVNTRFELLAGEILEMKNIVLKLQSFTMDVNKTLLEERNFNLFSKDDENEKIDIDNSIELSNSSNTEQLFILEQPI